MRHCTRAARNWLQRLMILTLAIAPAWGSTAEAADFVESATGVRFPGEMTADGNAFDCLGAGVRKEGADKLYAVSFYLAGRHSDAGDDFAEEKYPNLEGRALFNSLKADQELFETLASAPGDKMVALHLLKDFTKDQLAESFKKDLAGLLPKDRIAKLVAALPSEAHKGQTMVFRSDGTQLIVEVGGERQAVDDSTITTRIWDLWLGPKSVSPSLRESIARQVANGGAPTAA